MWLPLPQNPSATQCFMREAEALWAPPDPWVTLTGSRGKPQWLRNHGHQGCVIPRRQHFKVPLPIVCLVLSSFHPHFYHVSWAFRRYRCIEQPCHSISTLRAAIFRTPALYCTEKLPQVRVSKSPGYTEKSLIQVSKTRNDIHAINSILKIFFHNISVVVWTMIYFIHIVFILSADSLLAHFKLLSHY